MPPKYVEKGLSAKEWAEAIVTIVGGKAGGNEKTSQGVGSEVAKVEQAKTAALAFANSKLGL